MNYGGIMMKKMLIFLFTCTLLLFTSCNHQVTNPEQIDELPPIYPDYVGVTIPATIAPMNFDFPTLEFEEVDVVVKGADEKTLHVYGKQVDFPLDEWHTFLEENKGDSISFLVSIKQQDSWKQYQPFSMHISTYPIDYGIAYRKIAPGYEVYNKMGIYERNLATFEERALLENTMVPGMCVNCHAFNKTNPSHLSLHIRGEHGATLMQINGKEELLNTKTDSTISACVYPYWHPTGEYIAYSTNTTAQAFHVVREERIEVFDARSDVLVYHPQTHELIRSPLLETEESFETFPVFSADGRTLYFCSSKAQEFPLGYKDVRYNLCSIDFSPEEGSFGNKIDTLISVESMKKSVTFPRPSYDGKYIMYARADYGNFSIWHKEADLWLLNLQDGTTRPITEVNSDDTESFHNWSSNSRWFLFSSRRGDGLYTRIYLASIDEEGRIGKPFLLPQKRPWEYYDESLYSYNVPDFISSSVQMNAKRLERKIVSPKRVPVIAK